MRHRESGFTLVELTVVVVISTIALMAIYQTLITQEKTYRYQTAAIDAQGASRMAIQLLGSELRAVSASAGANTGRAGSDIRVAEADSIRFRSFRKFGLTCVPDTAGGTLHVWTMGSRFVAGDTLIVFLEGDTLSDEDDVWAADITLAGVDASSNATSCSSEWNSYPVQALRGFDSDTVALARRGALVRSYVTQTYGAYQYDGEWVLGRRNSNGAIQPLVGPILPPDSGGVEFLYYDEVGTQLTPTTEALRARIARIEITIRALSPGGFNNESYVDSLTTNVYLRGN